jgi:hypothetical protein
VTNPVIVAPSILSSDFSRIGEEVRAIEQVLTGADVEEVVHRHVFATGARFEEHGELHRLPAPALVDESPGVASWSGCCHARPRYDSAASGAREPSDSA